MATSRRRLDVELVRRGLSPSREQAQADIRSGRVTVGGAIADKAARLVAPGESLNIAGPGPRFVSRGGDKLAAALERFNIDPTGRRAIDCGASTGGFTDVLLQHGASQVVAVDVGRGQLHEHLRDDDRVQSHERTSLRGLDPEAVGGPAELVVADLSFISLRTVVADLLALCLPGADVVVLVKPQFEAGRQEASRGRGVISDPDIWLRVLGEVRDAINAGGAAIMGAMVSPLTGADGNVEFLLHLRAPEPMVTSSPAETIDGWLRDAVRAAVELRGAHG
ncbi:MAG: TlyA family RNA methyltransferase [Acidimicrobiales bacterium]|nr:TlyA family RNA methyltransferase [Acidimicrobiales bacterium]